MLEELGNRYKWYLLLIVPLSLSIGALKTGIFAAISQAIADPMGATEYWKAFTAAITTLFALSLINAWVENKVFSRINLNIQVGMIRKIIFTPYSHLEKIGLPKVMATLTEDTKTASECFRSIPSLVTNVTMLICGFAYMAYLSLSLFFLSILLLLIGIVSIALLIWFTNRYRIELREIADGLNKHYQDIVLGAKEINLNPKRKRFVKQQTFKTAGQTRVHLQRVLNVHSLTEQWIQMIVFVILGTVIYFSSANGIAAHLVAGYIVTLLFLMPAIFAIANVSNQIADARVAFKKIDSLELAETIENAKHEEMAGPQPNDLSGKTLILDKISYTHQGINNQFTLGPLSAEFNPGEATLIIGGNGSGKSTLLKVLSGLYQAHQGSIYFKDSESSCLTGCFSLISTDFWLFEEVLNDIGELCDDEMIHTYLDELMLSQSVSAKNSRLSTLNLSQGQRKRLALLQVYLEDNPVIIFDEWAADQDPDFKKVFYGEIIPSLKSKGKIVIFVSHDDNYYLKSADKILQLSGGKFKKLHFL